MYSTFHWSEFDDFLLIFQLKVWWIRQKKDAVRKIQPFVSNILKKLQHFIRLSIISWVATWRSIDCLSCCCCWNRRSCRLRRGIHRSVPTDRQVADDRRNPPAERRRRCANAATSNISRDDESATPPINSNQINPIKIHRII